MKTKLFILEVQNIQRDYARCLEFIKTIENKNILFKEGAQIVERFRKNLKICVGDIKRFSSPRYLEEPLYIHEAGTKGNLAPTDIVSNKHELNTEDVCEEELKHTNIHYLIRIHFTNSEKQRVLQRSELIQLHYLAMLLHRLEEFFQFEGNGRKRITVFIVPITANRYPFADKEGNIDYETYSYTSHYLRLLSQKYKGVIFGVEEEWGKPVVTSLSFRKKKKYEDYFPVLIVNQESYKYLLAENMDNSIIKELFSLSKKRRFRAANNEILDDSTIRDVLLETSINRLKVAVGNEKIEFIRDILFDIKQKNVIEFSLFSFVLSLEEGKEKREFKKVIIDTWNLASELSQGLKQIIQNAIQHTEQKTCFFSFYLHKYNGESLDALELLVSDLNEKEDIIDNFVRNLKNELNTFSKLQGENASKLLGHEQLIQRKSQIELANFFSEFRDKTLIDNWLNFREQDLVAHIGLSLFAITAKKCSATVKVTSSRDGKIKDSKNLFFKDYGEKNNSESFEQNHMFVLPGTQFNIKIPIQEISHESPVGLGEITQKNGVAETYRSFAKFLEYKQVRKELTIKKGGAAEQTSQILDANKKYHMVCQWMALWEKHIHTNYHYMLSEKKNGNTFQYVFNYDFESCDFDEYFQNKDMVEVCLRGLIGAIGCFDKLEENFYMALTNLPQGFVETFCKISVLLSVKKFPDHFQLFLHEKSSDNTIDNRIILLGQDFSQIVYNAYILSLEHGTNGYKRSDCELALKIKQVLRNGKADSKRNNCILEAFPFDALLPNVQSQPQTIFENHIRKIAENPMEGKKVGYKLDNTHMRLGSKVHIQAFYEMSFLFYRTTIANRIAFCILKRLKDESDKEQKDLIINIDNDNILFYGYASYSKAILTSVTEILREYRTIKNKSSDKVAFASYQHNLMSESENIQLYFGLPSKGFPGRVEKDNCLVLTEKVKIIQIVPISSTLTTFDKMWNRFYKSIIEQSKRNVCLYSNYTVFWVTDIDGNITKGTPSKIEKKYWKKVNNDRKVLTTLINLKKYGEPLVNFFVRTSVKWQDPLECELCYPQWVIEEVPLVETDASSTVPTQQIRGIISNNKASKSENNTFNNNRLLKLKECVYYDHICRRQNHYQFYIDTQKYFYGVKDEVEKWLRNQQKDVESEKPVLHIIFSPEHNTNVGFAQYVNTYYFNGLAELVSLNVDKEFRSNFICEHTALLHNIHTLCESRQEGEDFPIKFYFVDDTIITGETYEKANSLLQSLLPETFNSVNVFEKIFVLVDRLSEATKKGYIAQPKENFLSFVHIDVSNVRTYGDSCVGCKLEKNAQNMYKRSPTRTLAAYWYRKQEEYKKKAYDDRSQMAKINLEESFQMLLMAHVLQNTLVKSKYLCNMGEMYDVFLDLSLWMLDKNKKGNCYGYEELLGDMRNLNGIKVLLKNMCRPFLTFDFIMRRQSYIFYIFLTELMLGENVTDIVPQYDAESTNIEFLYHHDRINRTKLVADKLREVLEESHCKSLIFISEYLLAGLTDLGSTYLMRKSTLIKTYQFLRNNNAVYEDTEKKEFWDRYAANIYRLISNSPDESKELWLEYLYMTGQEYKEFKENSKKIEEDFYRPMNLYEAISGSNVIEQKDKHFYQFCHELFLQNTGIAFDVMEKYAQYTNVKNHYDEMIYSMEYWKQMKSLNQFQIPKSLKKTKLRKGGTRSIALDSGRTLFELLNNQHKKASVNDWYETLLENISNTISNSYDISKEEINIVMLTESIDHQENISRVQKLDIVEDIINYYTKGYLETCYNIKKRVVDALKNKDLFELEDNGYFISSEEKQPYVIIFFDNPGVNTEVYMQKNIAKVFLYISIKEKDDKNQNEFYMRLILRDVLMYRNRILRFLQKDFSGDIFAKYARTVGEKNILSHEKAKSHNTTADDGISVDILVETNDFFKRKYRELDSSEIKEWILLRNYTNGQIAKMFNRGFHENSDSNEKLKVPSLYISRECEKDKDNLFEQKLDNFAKLGIVQTKTNTLDKRFEMIKQVIDIKCADDVVDAEFIQGKDGRYYNLEYFKCLIIDICISAIKYKTGKQEYLSRINWLVDVRRKLKNSIDYVLDKEGVGKKLVEYWKEYEYPIYIFKECSPLEDVDYLVIQNPVDELAHKLFNWDKNNETIKHRLEDPLDFVDGHMSTLTIKRYVENLNIGKGNECLFGYNKGKSEYFPVDQLYFETKLPVLKRRNSDGK